MEDAQPFGFPESVQPPVVQAVICFTVLSYVFETFLDMRQLSVLREKKMRPGVEGLVSEETFEKARAYSLDKMRLHLLHSLLSFLQGLATLILAFLPWLWQLTAWHWTLQWGDRTVLDMSKEVEHSLLFLGCSSLIDLVLELPFSLISTFVIEQHHGFNKQTLGLFFLDMVKGMMLTVVIGAPVTAAIITIAKSTGVWLVPSLWAFSLLLSLFFLTIYPIAIAPLFNKFVPLADGTLKTSIEALASSLHFPLKRIFVVDGSLRSAHSNAYLFGFFGNKRIVLYDTLLKQCSEEEIVAVIAHELGHWQLNHTFKSFITSQVLTLFNFAGYAYVSSSHWIFSAFGFPTSQPVIIGFLLFQLMSIPISHVLTFVMHVISRLYEFQADEFAVKLGYARPLRQGLIKLQEENKSAMNTDELYSAYHYSHPPFAERIAVIDQSDLSKRKEE